MKILSRTLTLSYGEHTHWIYTLTCTRVTLIIFVSKTLILVTVKLCQIYCTRFVLKLLDYFSVISRLN
jgi:hypothetical protein